jgi:hypothetical protein
MTPVKGLVVYRVTVAGYVSGGLAPDRLFVTLTNDTMTGDDGSDIFLMSFSLTRG